MKKIILIVGILLISSCGYTPIYSSKESNYKIVNFKKNINNSLTNYIQNSINVLSNENADKVLNIDLELKEEIVVILKDSKGDPAKNRLIITVNLSVLNESENLIASKIFSETL